MAGRRSKRRNFIVGSPRKSPKLSATETLSVEGQTQVCVFREVRRSSLFCVGWWPVQVWEAQGGEVGGRPPLRSQPTHWGLWISG